MSKARFTVEPEKPAEYAEEEKESKPLEEKRENAEEKTSPTPINEIPREPGEEPGDHDENDDDEDENDDGDDVSDDEAASAEVKAAEQALNIPTQTPTNLPELPTKEIVEAALFIANKPLHKKDISKTTGLDIKKVEDAIIHLSNDYALRPGALEIVYDGESASMHVKGPHVQRVSAFSKQMDLSRKALRILALVSKKKGMLQSDLRLYFKGEIYDYITELKERGYLNSERYKNTRLLKPTKKFYESFQLA